jgi:hypothetical protein
MNILTVINVLLRAQISRGSRRFKKEAEYLIHAKILKNGKALKI